MSEHEVEVNDPDYYMSEPKRQIGCSLPSTEDYEAAVAALVAHGINTEDLKALHGQEGADIMDLTGEHHGFFAGIRRIFPTINNDIMLNMSNVEEALKAGGYALAVPAAEFDDAREIANILRQHNASNMLYFGKKNMWRMN